MTARSDYFPKDNGPTLIENVALVDGQKYTTKDKKRYDIFLKNGEIESIVPTAKTKARVKSIDATGLTLMPAFVDIHVHLREPGQEYKEDLKSGLEAALAGGFSDVVSMPNTKPVIDREELVRFLIQKAKEHDLAHLHPGATTSIGAKGDMAAPHRRLYEAGARVFTDDGWPVKNPVILRQAMRSLGDSPALLMEHAEEKGLSANGVMHEGKISYELGLDGIPEASETIAVFRGIEILRAEGRGSLHFTHLSSGRSTELIRRARDEGLSVTADVTPHHLLLSEERLRNYDANFKMNPPLRTDEDREKLLAALREGVVDCVATDHAPHSEFEKERGIEDAPFGVTGLETAFSTIHTDLVSQGKLSLEELVTVMSRKPRELIGLAGGIIAEKQPASLVLVSLGENLEINPRNFFSRSSNSAFLGKKVQGKILATWVHGKLRFKNVGLSAKP